MDESITAEFTTRMCCQRVSNNLKTLTMKVFLPQNRTSSRLRHSGCGDSNKKIQRSFHIIVFIVDYKLTTMEVYHSNEKIAREGEQQQK